MVHELFDKVKRPCYIERMNNVTPRQREMLRAFHEDGEATDFADYDNCGTLAWLNRERVIDALRRKGLLDDDGVTDAGRKVLGLTQP